MKYLQVKSDSSLTTTIKKLKPKRTYSSKELFKLISDHGLFTFRDTNDFTNSAFCRKNFDVVTMEEDKSIETYEDGYSKHGRHIPENVKERDVNSLKNSHEILKLLKKMKATSACLVVNARGKKPATINIR